MPQPHKPINKKNKPWIQRFADKITADPNALFVLGAAIVGLILLWESIWERMPLNFF